MMASHSSTLAWKISWAEEPGRLQSVGSRRVGHDWATSLSLFTFLHWRRKWQPTPVFLPDRLPSMGSHRAGHEWSDLAAAAAAAVKVLVAQSCPTLCDCMDYSPPGSSVHGILQARILEGAAISFSRGSSQPRDQTQVFHIAGGFLAVWATREATNTGMGSLSLLQASSWPRNQTRVSCISGRFFTSWATRDLYSSS